MADAVATVKARKKMMLARAGEATLPKIVGFVFGDGGVDEAGEPLLPDETQTSLNHELLRKTADGHTVLSDLSCRYTCTLEEDELVNQDISEIALYDEEGDLVAIRNFKAKGKDSDLEMEFRIDDVF